MPEGAVAASDYGLGNPVDDVEVGIVIHGGSEQLRSSIAQPVTCRLAEGPFEERRDRRVLLERPLLAAKARRLRKEHRQR